MNYKPYTILLSFLWIFITISNVSTIVLGQTPVGYKFDINGHPFDGYYDPLIYHPAEKIIVSMQSDSYEVGYYYDQNLQKFEGLIKFENKKIWYKQNELETKDKLKPDEVNHLVIGVDSFFTITNFTYNEVLKIKPEFVQFIGQIENVTFVKYYHFANSMESYYGSVPIFTETFYARRKEEKEWVNLSISNNHLKEKAIEYFNHIPYLAKKIYNGDYKTKNILSLIKAADYLKKYNNNQPIYFDLYWEEITDIQKARYHAYIVDVNDSVWNLAYFEDKTKLYEIEYASFFPHIKNGQFKSFYPSGKTRQIIEYIEGKPRDVKTFNEDGSIFQEYHYKDIFEIDKPDTIVQIVYTQLNNTRETSLNDSVVQSVQLVDDTISKCTYMRIYHNENLVSSSYKLNDLEVFQFFDPDCNVSIKSVQRAVNSYMEELKFYKAFNDNAQGLILVSFVIDPKGFVISHKVLNILHPELDMLLESFIDYSLSPTSVYKSKFKPCKKGKEKTHYEIIVPFEFVNNRFYRKPVNYYHNPFFMQNHMMQQQMIQQHQMQSVPKTFGGYR